MYQILPCLRIVIIRKSAIIATTINPASPITGISFHIMSDGKKHRALDMRTPVDGSTLLSPVGDPLKCMASYMYMNQTG